MDQVAKTGLESKAAEREKAAREWYEANKAVVDSINNFIEKHGLLANRLRYRPVRE
jgi:post-segregation antitoxin (ccd killing protein)